MWDEDTQQQFDELRRRKLDGCLTEEEQRQLSLLSEELDRGDEAYLRPAFEHSLQWQRNLDNASLTKSTRC